MSVNEIADRLELARSTIHNELHLLADIGTVQRITGDRSVVFQRIDGPFWRLYAAILSSDHEFGSEQATVTKGNLDTLRRLDLEQNRPLLLAALQHFTKPELRKLLRALVSWSVRLGG